MTEKLSQFTQQTPTLANFVAGANVGSPNQKYSLSDIQTLFGPATVTGPSVTAVTGAIYVNSFYPSNVPNASTTTNLGSSNSRPLSNFYSTLAAAQAAFPNLNFATYGVTLADEVDWCAWQSCMDYIFNFPNLIGANKFPAARVIANGRYAISKTILVRATSMIIEGVVNPFFTGNVGFVEPATWINYTGPLGTIDTNIPIIALDTSTLTTTAGKIVCRYLGFMVFQAAVFVFPLTNINQASFVNAIQIGLTGNLTGQFNTFCEIDHCAFSGGLWDGIKVITPQIDLWIYRNDFAGIQRDAISICAIKNNFSTTTWIDHNEYGGFGRYGILINCDGAVAPMMIIKNESMEGMQGGSLFVQNPEWYVQGVVAPICLIDAGNSTIADMRYEGDADFISGVYAGIHLVASGDVTLDRYKGRNIFLSTFSVAAQKTAAATTFLNTNLYLDITNQRNYNANTAVDFSNIGVSGLKIKSPFNNVLNWVFMLGTRAVFNATDVNYLENCQYRPVVIGTFAGTFATLAQPRTTASPTISFLPLASHAGCPNIIDASGSYTLNYVASSAAGSKSGLLVAIAGINLLSTWQASHAYVVDTDLSHNPFISPVTENGFIFQCTTAGVSGLVEPVWPTVIGNTVNDGGVTWTCAAPTYVQAEVGGGGRPEQWISGFREWVDTAAPTQGTHNQGDKVRQQGPTSGGFVGFVCTQSGTPGVWKTYGLIS